jgi:hypothetical protein
MIAEPRPGLKVTWRKERETNIPKASHSGCGNSLLTFHKVARRINGPKREVTGRWRKSTLFWVVTQFGKRPTFRGNISPPSSGSKNKPSKKPARRWGQCVPPKRWAVCDLQDVKIHKIVLFIATDLGTLNPTRCWELRVHNKELHNLYS